MPSSNDWNRMHSPLIKAFKEKIGGRRGKRWWMPVITKCHLHHLVLRMNLRFNFSIIIALLVIFLVISILFFSGYSDSNNIMPAFPSISINHIQQSSKKATNPIINQEMDHVTSQESDFVNNDDLSNDVRVKTDENSLIQMIPTTETDVIESLLDIHRNQFKKNGLFEQYNLNLQDGLEKKTISNTLFNRTDAQHLHGLFGVDLNGNPIWKPKPITFRQTQKDKILAHTGYCFNSKVSDSLLLDRPVPDYNSRQCHNVIYPTNLPKASVVVVFYNENLSVLLRSIHSILNRTPPSLLKEVIIVDDYSNITTHPWLGVSLDLYIHQLPKVVLRRLEKRHGLMLGRMAGADWATGDVLIFLDSHIETTNRWIEPLLFYIYQDKKTVVVPLIHTIDADSFQFERSSLGVLTFSWSLGQVHDPNPPTDFDPMPSPIMAGGLFAINKKWFYDLGCYDKEFRLYGGEEVEIGFKTWMCGGKLLVIPCSRVGHVFRTPKYWSEQVYKVPSEEIHRNKLRVAAVWMDEYEIVAKIAIPQLPSTVTLGSIDEAKSVRDRLKCQSFKWYLNNVVPDMYLPNLEGATVGAIRAIQFNACLDTLTNSHPGESIGAYPCHNQQGTQVFLYDANGNIRLIGKDPSLCIRSGSESWLSGLTLFSSNELIITKNCSGSEFLYEGNSTKQFVLKSSLHENHTKQCLRVVSRQTEKSPYDLQLGACSSDQQSTTEFEFDSIPI